MTLPEFERSSSVATALREAEDRYRDLIERIPAVVYLCDSDAAAIFRYVSPQVEQLLGITPAELLEDDELWYRSIHPEDYERVRSEELRCHAAGVEFECEYRMIARDGAERHVWEREGPLPAAGDGPRSLTQGVVVDVTTLRTAEAALRAERDRAQRYVDVAGATLLALDPDGGVTMLNRAGYELLGYDDGSLLGVDWFATCLPAEESERARAAYKGHLAAEADGPPPAELRVIRRDGSERMIAWQSSLLRETGRAVGLLCSGIDISERRQAEEQVAHLAYHDSLTGLPNRMMLQEHLELALARARRQRRALAVLYLDLDDFKLVNDGLGHSAGDELLCQVASRIRRQVRKSDLVARQGGDEFLVLLADLAHDAESDALTAAEYLVAVVREPYRIGGVEFEIGVSIGVSLFPQDAQDAVTLLEHADAAMYEAKDHSRGQVRVFRSVPPRRSSGIERLSESRRLRRAIADGALTLHWQPIFDLVAGQVAGVEALARWNDPDRGLRSAGEFVPIAERSGLMDALDDWVVAALGRQRREWRAAGLDPWVGFNLSPHQLRPERIPMLLDGLRAGGDLERVTIEITEGVAVHQDGAAGGVLETLRDAGLSLALDDFGVAYSSLSRLAALPVRWVKVDRSFLPGVPGSAGPTRVLRSIMDLIGALGLRAIVEGIESEEQVRHIVAQGWTMGQGYHLGAPMPAAEVEPLLRASPASQAT